MAFTDFVKIKISAGRGGDGVVRWRREKFKPLAGPGGGNGGRGGNVYIAMTSDLSQLFYYKSNREFYAQDGAPGANFSCEGKNGEDLVLYFPKGTVLTNLNTGSEYELANPNDKILILRGGRGGLGNEHFKSSKNRAPYESTSGRDGESGEFTAELRLFADIGLVGFPSAGKSTILNNLTRAHSVVGAYDFTTLEPHLGVLSDGTILADLPGLIQGAAMGKGLGHLFLRHIKRTKMIAHVISLEYADNLRERLDAVRDEIRQYDSGLLQKKQFIIFTKADLLDQDTFPKKRKEIGEDFSDFEVFFISELDEQSIQDLRNGIIQMLTEQTQGDE